MAFSDSDDWEVVYDDGFVYKRMKRRLDPTSLAHQPNPDPDPVSDDRKKIARKKKALVQLKNKYAKEISHWEYLSNKLKAMEENAIISRGDDEFVGREDRINQGSRSASSMKKRSGSWVDGLLLQVEAQEEFMHSFSHLCDVAEFLCDAQDEKNKRVYLDLPLWTCSPQELMASLTDD